MTADTGHQWVSSGRQPGPSLRACLEAATTAPSIHNTQPWLFGLRGGGIDLLVDHNRRLNTIDPAGRALVVSIGAALFNLRVAMLAHGRTPMIQLRPPRDDPRLVARVAVGMPVGPTETVRRLAQAIPRRRTNRRPFTGHAIPADVRAELVAACAAEGAILAFADGASTDALLNLVSVAEEQWRHDPAYWAELDRWTRLVPGRRDGVATEAFGPRPALESLPLRDFGLVVPVRGRRTEPFEREPIVAVLYTVGDGVRQWLRAGQALQRVLLTATVRGVAQSMMTQPLEDPSLRSLLVQRGVRYPQAIIRLGYGPPAVESPRRPLAEVLVPVGGN